jgi:hypothetical protein
MTDLENAYQATVNRIKELEKGLQQLEWDYAEANALVLSHEQHIADLNKENKNLREVNVAFREQIAELKEQLLNVEFLA